MMAALAAAFALTTAPRAYDRARMRSAAERLGPQAVAALGPLQEMLQQAAGLDEESRLEPINAWFNRRVIFRTDDAAWGESDHWASPLEVLQVGHGDCEDYAIAKYFSLIAAGTRWRACASCTCARRWLATTLRRTWCSPTTRSPIPSR